MLRIWKSWDNAIAAPISQNARPAAFKGNELLVHVESSTWIQHLQFYKNELIDNLNGALGTTMIKTIKFKIGPL